MKPSLSLLLLLSVSMSSLVQIATADKILVMAFFSSKSHKITYMTLIEELASRGHEITVVTPIPAAKSVKNIKEIMTVDAEKLWEGKFDMFKMKEDNVRMNPFMMIEEFGSLCRETYDLPQVKALMNQKFDLIFVQPIFNDCAFGLVHKLNAPVIFFYPTSVPSFAVSKMGGHLPPSFVPNIFLGYSDEMTFVQRFYNFGATVFTEAVMAFYYEPAMAAIYREKLGQDIPSVREIFGNTSIILSNGHFSLQRPKPLLPDIIDVGGIHSKPAKPLPKDLEDFITKGGKDGFILFSMGSALKGSTMSEQKRKIFLNVFSKLKQQVLWKWESETMPDLPKNVKLSKWLPQQDLLGHKDIRMFVTHCGGGSTEEAIYHGVPLLGLPMFGDQHLNAKQNKNHGFLLELEWNDLTEEMLLNGINEILGDSKFRDNAQRLSKIFKDQPDDPLQRGVFWVEYVLRHKGAPHLRSAGRKLNYLQYHSWDVMAAYLAIIFTGIYMIFAIIRLVCRKLCGSSKKQSDADKRKKKN